MHDMVKNNNKNKKNSEINIHISVNIVLFDYVFTQSMEEPATYTTGMFFFAHQLIIELKFSLLQYL
jgi:hypothetical protein